MDQAPMIGVQEVVPLELGDRLGEGPPSFRVDRAHALDEPVDLLLPRQENAAQYEGEATLWMDLTVGERQR